MARLIQDWRAEEWNLTPDATKNNADELERNRSPYLSFPCEDTGGSGQPPQYDVVYTHFKGKTLPDYEHSNGLEACLVWFIDEDAPVDNQEDVQWEVAIHRIPDDCTDNIDIDAGFTFNVAVDTPCVGAFGALEGIRNYTTVDLPIDDGLVRGEFFELEIRRICGDTNTGNTGDVYDVGLQFVALHEKDR